MPSKQRDVPVLIVGAGPAGLVASLALSRYGVEHLLIERHPATAHTPRAHIVNQRTVEILRHLGIEDRFHAVATPQEFMRNNLWVTSVAGREIIRSETWGTSARVAGEYQTSSPCPMANCPQTVFEPMLVDAIRDAGGNPRFQHELETLEQDQDGVTSTVRDRATGELIIVRSKYLIGADGARSRVLDRAGLSVDGPAGLAHAANVWFEADLSRYLAHRPGVLTWNVMPGPLPPGRLGTLICHKPFTEFVLVFFYDPAQKDLAALTNDDLVGRARAAIGDNDIEVTIKGTAGWQVNAQVAPVYSAGRVFCMGDAVHRHPPTNGLGLNMSVADAYNLAWKLALVVDGRAGAALLDSYTTERQPVGAEGVDRAITSLADMAAVDAALGFQPGQSDEDGWAALAALDEPGPAGAQRRQELRDAVARTDYQFNAHGLELGYVYTSDAVIPEPEPAPKPAADAHLHHRPTSRPGARVPHARLELDGTEMSTLDLIDGLGFTILTGPGGEPWAEAAAEITTQTGVPITVHVIGRGTGGPTDPYGEWAERREVDCNGCVLVRPDRHVAWRYQCFDAVGADTLQAVVDQVLARNTSAHRVSQPEAAGIGVAEPPALGASTMAQAFLRTIARRGNAAALRASDGATEIRYDELPELLRSVAAALAAHGVARGDTVGLMLTNRPEFHVIDGAAMLMGATPFSVYNTAPPEQLAFVIGDAGARIVLTERQFAPVIAKTTGHGLELDHVIVIDDDSSWSAFLGAGGDFDLDAAAAAVQPDDLLTLIYTSGTTGPPKGVQLTQANMLAMLRSLHAAWPTKTGGRVLSYLPQAHAADRWFSHYSALMTYGATVTDIAMLSDLIPTTMQVRPTFWGGVPRVWEKLKSALQAGAFGPLDDPARVREVLGFDKSELFVIGAAPTTLDVLEFFANLGIEICEAWGMSETSAIGTVNRPRAARFGSVGQAIPGVDVKLADDGELLCNGANVMAGYRNNPQKTAESIDADGWLHTGDVARIDEDGFVWIVDRKKELIINTAGKNMSPANIESKLKAAGPLIGQACVIGDRRPYNVALLVLDPETGAGLDPADPATVAAVQREVDTANAQLSRVEQIKRFTLLADEWLPGGDELTPTMKLKRRPISDKYAATIDALYD